MKSCSCEVSFMRHIKRPPAYVLTLHANTIARPARMLTSPAHYTPKAIQKFSKPHKPSSKLSTCPIVELPISRFSVNLRETWFSRRFANT